MARSQPIERQIIARNGIKTAIALIVTFLLLYFVVPIPLPNFRGKMLDKLIFTLRLQSFSCLTLIGGIHYVASTRFETTAIDPINGRGEHHVIVGTRYLTNTVEQLIISVLGQLILTTYLSDDQMRVIPILVLFFVVGRIGFFFGYRKSYLKRTFGFAATFLPSVAMWIVIFVLTVSNIMS